MLTNICNHNGIIIHQLANCLNQLLWHNVFTMLLISKWILIIHFNNIIAPDIETSRIILPRALQQMGKNRHGPAQISHYWIICYHILVNFRSIHIKMNHLGLRSKGCYLANNPVIKADTYTNQQITFLNSHISCIGTMHTHHAQKSILGRRHTAQAHQRADYRNMGMVYNLTKQLCLIGQIHTAANKEQRTLGLA